MKSFYSLNTCTVSVTVASHVQILVRSHTGPCGIVRSRNSPILVFSREQQALRKVQYCSTVLAPVTAFFTLIHHLAQPCAFLYCAALSKNQTQRAVSNSKCSSFLPLVVEVLGQVVPHENDASGWPNALPRHSLCLRGQPELARGPLRPLPGQRQPTRGRTQEVHHVQVRALLQQGVPEEGLEAA